MPIGSLAGRARASFRTPRAKGECDRCGVWYQLDDLTMQRQWAGASLIDTGYLVCMTCLDEPSEQNRAIILPPDPEPRKNPRPSQDAQNAKAANNAVVGTMVVGQAIVGNTGT